MLVIKVSTFKPAWRRTVWFLFVNSKSPLELYLISGRGLPHSKF